jgi:polyhydroxyalkanoate synthase
MMMEAWQKSSDIATFLATDPIASARTGRTPHAVIHRENKSCIRYFAPVQALADPVFISMPLINTWTIFDLLPGRSVIEGLLAAGTPVYLLDWGRPGPEDREVSIADLVDRLLPRAVDRVRRHAAVQHADRHGLQAIGYCVGGTFLSMFMARYPETFTRVAFVATPIDFHASGRLACWANPESFPLDTVIDGYGNFPKDLMKSSFAWLKPTGQVGKWKGLWDGWERPGFAELWSALEQWNADNVHFPGETYREYVRNCYFENRLVRGGWNLGGRVVDLGQCKVPALAIAANKDHIVEPPAAFGLAEVWGGTVTCKALDGGHVGICVGKSLPAALAAWVTG